MASESQDIQFYVTDMTCCALLCLSPPYPINCIYTLDSKAESRNQWFPSVMKLRSFLMNGNDFHPSSDENPSAYFSAAPTNWARMFFIS